MTIRDKFELAFDYYQKERLDLAKEILIEILKLEPNNPDALHLLGIIYYQFKNFDSAEECLGRSLELNPNEAFVYFNLANILKDNQKPGEAINNYRKALKINPALVDAYYNLGIIFEETGQLDEAKISYEKALEIDEKDADLYNNLGVVLQKKGQTDEAITCYEKAILRNPDNAKTYYNLGVALHADKQFRAAIRNYQKAIQLKSDFADAYNELGTSFREEGLLDEAITYYEKTLQFNPNRDNTYYNLGFVFREKGLFEEAIANYQKAIQINPRHIDAYNNLGIILQDNKQVDEAITCYRRALQIDDYDAVTHWNLSTALLLSGDYENGWKEYEWRLKVKDFHQPDFKSPLWDGSDISNRTILLYAEQGFGDTIQFIRYAPLLANRGARVIVYCQKELSSLLQDVEGVNLTVAYGERLPEYDIYCPLPSLPFVFGTTIGSIPATIPYMKANHSLVQYWREKVYGADAKIRIGLVWAGREQRSFALELLSPLLRFNDIVFYSLQKGDAAEEVKNFNKKKKFMDYTEDIKDFSDTAALIQNLDLIVSVDTSVAHLAGALGRPVWNLLSFAPDWRWMLDREDSPWYPSMRLFRQTSIGDWESVVVKVMTELQGFSVTKG